ncbi:hypothetical protein [Actinokineospora diospyrosa]|uniref:XRE family transcriptional regulator n=1 Tax=Actinokineospora diospyrosa TaxID=103728 RepID=A0ABT1I5Z4_9PSEU|nr:hypothetical protein [Actinokineospora diospyrosa]MCP2267996.1 hypothetical protein [Actinokineospora diospyrosa]
MPIRRPVVADPALAALLAELRLVHVAAGEPTVRDLAVRSGGRISRDTVHRVLAADRVPRWRNLELVVLALGGDVDRFHELWVAARAAEVEQR